LGTVWSVIKNEKDINLPGEKLILSQFRCNTLKDEAYALIESKLESLAQECN